MRTVWTTQPRASAGKPAPPWRRPSHNGSLMWIQTTCSERSGRPAHDPIISWPAVAALIVGAAFAVVELREPGYSAAGVAAVVAFACFVVLVFRRWWRRFFHSCDR